MAWFIINFPTKNYSTFAQSIPRRWQNVFCFNSKFTSLSMLLIQFANLIGIKDRLIQLLINYDNYLYFHEKKGTRIFSRYIFSPPFSRYIFFSFVCFENRKTVECVISSVSDWRFQSQFFWMFQVFSFSVNKGLFSLGNVSVFFVTRFILLLLLLRHIFLSRYFTIFCSLQIIN